MSIRGMDFSKERKPGKGFDSWLTAPDILELARSTMGSIDFDPASNFVAQKYVKAKQFCVAPKEYESYDIDSQMGLDSDIPINALPDGLKQSWIGNVWVNPPYSAGNIDKFVNKGIAELDKPYVKQMMFLVNSSTDCQWYHKLLNNCDMALLWRGRIKFWKIENGQAWEKWEGVKSKELGLGKIGNSPRYLSTLFYYGNNEKTFMDHFASKGTFIKVAR